MTAFSQNWLSPMICSECKGDGGWFPIVGEGHNRLGYPYPIEGPWQRCQICKGRGHMEGSEEDGSASSSEEGSWSNGEPKDNHR